MEGTTILHYEILELIGRGAMGTVYKARDTHLDMFRAVKFIREDVYSVDSARQSLHREARTQAQLIHPHIASVFALESSETGEFIVQEYVDGPGLDLYMQTVDPPLETRLKMILEVTSALAYAHTRGVIHRDIKPSNVLISSEGQAKVTDFGLARALEQSTQTSTIGTKGTAPYMAPETFQGREISYPTDVWALGILAYEVLEGERPFIGATFESLAMHILSEQHSPISDELESEVPGLREWVETCLRKNPGERFEDCTAALNALAEIVETAGFKVSVQYPISLPTRSLLQNKTIVGAALFAAVAIISGTFLLIFPSTDYPSSLSSTELNRLDLTSQVASVSWNSSGDRFVFVDNDQSAIQVINTSDPQAAPIPHRLGADDILKSAAWAPNSSIIAVIGGKGAYLYDLESSSERQIVDFRVHEMAWFADGDSIVFTDFAHTDRTVFICGPLRNALVDRNAEIAVRVLRVTGITEESEPLQIYSPQVALDNTHLIFTAMKSEKHMGVWMTSLDGGASMKIVDHECLPWNLDWCEESRMLIFSQYPANDLFVLPVGKNGNPRVSEMVSLESNDPISIFDYSPYSDSYVAFVELFNDEIWSTSLAGDVEPMRPLVKGYRYLTYPSLMGERDRICFSEVAQTGMKLHAYNFADSTVVDLLPPDQRYREMQMPAPSPGLNRYVVFRGFNGEKRGLFYYDHENLNWGHLATDPVNGRLLSPVWSNDGQAVYCIIFPSDLNQPRRVIQLTVDRSSGRLAVTDSSQVFEDVEISCYQPDASGRFFVYSQPSRTGGPYIVIYDREYRRKRDIITGDKPALDPGGKYLYYYHNSAIYRISNWTEESVRREPEYIVGIPRQIAARGYIRSILVGSHELYVILRVPSLNQSQLIWSRFNN